MYAYVCVCMSALSMTSCVSCVPVCPVCLYVLWTAQIRAVVYWKECFFELRQPSVFGSSLVE